MQSCLKIGKGVEILVAAFILMVIVSFRTSISKQTLWGTLQLSLLNWIKHGLAKKKTSRLSKLTEFKINIDKQP